MFGPIDLRRSSPTWGQITTTPKPGWGGTNLVSTIRGALQVPIAIDTDVNAAAVAEWRWGAAVGLETFCYITVGTGIGGGVVANGRLVHGLLHPEIGHMRIPHDRVRDPFDGVCPYHGGCLEGLASGEAMRRRWSEAAETLQDIEAWELEAEYLALAVVNIVCMLSPQRVIIGGGVAKYPGLLPLVRQNLQRLLDGYLSVHELVSTDSLADYIVAPGLGDLAGVLGAIELAHAV
jgi:fructokinase